MKRIATVAILVLTFFLLPGEALAGGGSAELPVVGRGPQVHYRNSFTNGPADTSIFFGNRDNVHLMGDWDGNGTKTPGVYIDGGWHLRNSNTSGDTDIFFKFGADNINNPGQDLPGDVPVVGDWNNDGIDTPGIFRDGMWRLRNSNTAGQPDGVFRYGNPTDIPVPGDWNRDGTDTLGVFRNGRWFLSNFFDKGVADGEFLFGNPTDVPVPGDWNNDGTDTFGVFRGGTWYLSNFFDKGSAEMVFVFGQPGDQPFGWR